MSIKMSLGNVVGVEFDPRNEDSIRGTLKVGVYDERDPTKPIMHVKIPAVQDPNCDSLWHGRASSKVASFITPTACDAPSG